MTTPHPSLFETPTVPRTGPLGNAEPTVRWYTESTRPEADTSRALVNHWYRSMPDPNGRLALRIRSENNVDHNQAIDEMLVHQLLRTNSSDIRYEEGGMGPDFRVYRDGALAGAVEVLSLFEPQVWSDGQLRSNRLTDSLNERLGPPRDWFIGITGDLDDFPINEVPVRECAGFLRNELANLPSPVGLAIGHDDWPHRTFRYGDESIVFCFIPRTNRPDIEEPGSRIMALGPAVGGMIDVGGRLKSRIGKKRPDRYNFEDNLPYLVFAVLHDSFGDDWDVKNALYGHSAVEIESGRSVRQGDGLFGLENRGGKVVRKNSRIAGVGVCTRRFTWSIQQVDVAIYENPYARVPWPDLMSSSRRFEKQSNGTLDWSSSITNLDFLSPPP